MADIESIRISELPIATELFATDYFLIVQSGVSKRVEFQTLVECLPQRNYLSSMPITPTFSSQADFDLPDYVLDVEAIYINGNTISPANYIFSAPELSFVDLPYQLEPSDTVIIVYSTVPQG